MSKIDKIKIIKSKNDDEIFGMTIQNSTIKELL